MNELQSLWLSAYRSWIQAASPLGELSTHDYAEAKEFADSVLVSVQALGDKKP